MSMSDQNSSVIHVRVPTSEYEQLEKIGKDEERSLNYLVNKAIRLFLIGFPKKARNGK